jgi:hypothetical protein
LQQSANWLDPIGITVLVYKANDILKAASAFFAQAELDRRIKS